MLSFPLHQRSDISSQNAFTPGESTMSINTKSRQQPAQRDAKARKLPFFGNRCGGHWHRLRLISASPPQWLLAPARRGLAVAALLPGSSRGSLIGGQEEDIPTRGRTLKGVVCELFGVRTIRGVLKRMPDNTLRESVRD